MNKNLETPYLHYHSYIYFLPLVMVSDAAKVLTPYSEIMSFMGLHLLPAALCIFFSSLPILPTTVL